MNINLSVILTDVRNLYPGDVINVDGEYVKVRKVTCFKNVTRVTFVPYGVVPRSYNVGAVVEQTIYG